MKLHLDYRNPTPSHCEVGVFLDGALVGVLTLRQDDLATFQHILIHGIQDRRDTFLGTGNPEPPLEARAKTEGVSFEGVLLAMGFVAGGLTQPAIFTALAEAIQNRGLEPGHVVFLRDTLTRALQLAGCEPLDGAAP